QVRENAQIDGAAGERGDFAGESFHQRIDGVRSHRIPDVGDYVHCDRTVRDELRLDLACAAAALHHARLEPPGDVEKTGRLGPQSRDGSRRIGNVDQL